MSPRKAAATNRPAATISAARFVCSGCSLLCDDLTGTTNTGCVAADRWFASGTDRPVTTIDRQPATIDESVNAAAHRLASARRVLVTGLTSLPLEAIRLACQIAERLTAAVDAGTADTSLLTGPTIARVGEVTAAFEELRDRADLVIFWGCDPAASHPRFIERFVHPTRPNGDRRTISLGPQPVLPAAANHLHLPLKPDLFIAAARLLQASIKGYSTEPAEGPLAAVVSELKAAIDAASCIGIVSSTMTDPTGLTGWSLAQLVRALAHRKPAFQIPLGAGTADGGGNTAGVAASSTWRYGAPGAIAAADRDGSEFQPAEADAVRLISRGEVDCVLAVGRLAPRLEAALVATTTPPVTIRITDVAPASAAATAVVLGTASLPQNTAGIMLREDGRATQLTPIEAPKHLTVEHVLEQLLQAIETAGEDMQQIDVTTQPAFPSGNA